MSNQQPALKNVIISTNRPCNFQFGELTKENNISLEEKRKKLGSLKNMSDLSKKPDEFINELYDDNFCKPYAKAYVNDKKQYKLVVFKEDFENTNFDDVLEYLKQFDKDITFLFIHGSGWANQGEFYSKLNKMFKYVNNFNHQVNKTPNGLMYTKVVNPLLKNSDDVKLEDIIKYFEAKNVAADVNHKIKQIIKDKLGQSWDENTYDKISVLIGQNNKTEKS